MMPWTKRQCYGRLRHCLSMPTYARAMILAGQLMIVLDGTVIYTILPAMLRDLGFSRANLSWVQNAYLLTFGGFMLLGARIGDIVGHRLVFMMASASFAIASMMAGLAPSALYLISARAIQGLAAAFAAPSALALLMILFPPGPTRIRALSLYTAVSGAGSVVGFLLGGMLTELVSWRSVLFINLPIGMVLLVLSPFSLPRVARHPGPFDGLGALIVTCGMSLLVYGLVGFARGGVGYASSAMVMGMLLLVLFVQVERRAKQPIMPLTLFSCVRRSGAYASKTLLIGGMLGTFFFLTQYVQQGLGFNAWEAGLAFIPLSVAQFLMVLYGVPRLISRMGATRLLLAGLSMACVGMIGLSGVDGNTRFFPELALPIVLLGIGSGAALVPLATVGIFGVDAGDTGAASGLMNVTHYLGGALGTAILVFIVDRMRHVVVNHDIANPIMEVHNKHELAHALSVAATTSAIFFALALLICGVTMRRKRSDAHI